MVSWHARLSVSPHETFCPIEAFHSPHGSLPGTHVPLQPLEELCCLCLRLAAIKTYCPLLPLGDLQHFCHCSYSETCRIFILSLHWCHETWEALPLQTPLPESVSRTGYSFHKNHVFHMPERDFEDIISIYTTGFNW